MFLVGLTGGIATGKSSVASMLKVMGVEIIDADLIAREGKSVKLESFYLLNICCMHSKKSFHFAMLLKDYCVKK